MTAFTLPNIPGEYHWKNQPLDWKIEPNGAFTILAGEHTDWFSDPGGGNPQDSAPCALFMPPDKDFILSARVAVNFESTFDAGTFQVRENDELWAKLCFEFSPQRQPMIVSVVTRGKSDDCNSVAIEKPEVHLRMAITPQTIAFHYSNDGAYWHFVRFFTLGKLENLQVGFSAQSPLGTQCKAVFSEMQYRAGVLKDTRNGE